MMTKILNPTIHFHVGYFNLLPYPSKIIREIDKIKTITDALVSEEKADWDSFETSWDFKESMLLRNDMRQSTIKETYTQICSSWHESTLTVQRLEEENNLIFIEAYDLQDELIPEVPLNEITLTINPKYRYGGNLSDEELAQRFQSDTLVELISYAIGCMMGRYRIDKPGLIYAHAGNVDFEKIYNTQGDRDEGRGVSEELSGLDCMAEVNGTGGAYLSNDQSVSERGALRTGQSGSEGGSIDSIEHSGGACAAESIGVSELSIHSAGFESGSRNANVNSRSSGICDTRTSQGDTRIVGGNIENAQRVAKGARGEGLGIREVQSESSSNPSHLTPNPFIADADGIIPLTDQEWFKDDATNRFRDFVRTVWGEENLPSNLDFVAESLCLNTLKPKKSESSLETIRRYLSNQFYKDHTKTYKKRPIYWLFSSGKKKAFECLVYLHRYNESTLSRIRTEYVTPILGKYDAFAVQLNKQLEDATTSEAILLKKELVALEKKQTELRAFDDHLKHYADMRIKLDLDDGVKVNYGKFGDLLAEVKAITGGKE